MRQTSLARTLRLPPDLPRYAAELALVALLAVQAARLVWLVAAPAGPLGAPAAPLLVEARDAAVLARIDPFAPSSQPVPAEAGEFKLVGIRADGHGGGAAFLSVGPAPQRVYQAGEEIAPSVKLKSIAIDHVVLARSGAEIRVALLPISAAGAAAVPPYLVAPPPRAQRPASPSPFVVSTDPANLLDQVGLRPRLIEGRISGYTLLPRGDGALMRAAGLEAGDVLVALNGNHLTPERYSELAQELDAPEVQLTVQRGAEMRTITLKTGK